MLDIVKYLVGSVGPSGYGSKSTADQVTPDLRSITAIITGATSGIGAETARVLAKRGARLVLPARNVKAAEEVRARIVSEWAESEIFVMSLDLSSLNSVRKFVSEFESLNLPLNLLMYVKNKCMHFISSIFYYTAKNTTYIICSHALVFCLVLFISCLPNVSSKHGSYGSKESS